MARKLRIYAGPEHGLEGHPALLPFQMPPRKLREKGVLFELPEGFEPFNPAVYQKRYGHRLNKAAAAPEQQSAQQQQQQQQHAGQQRQRRAAAASGSS